ncbi:Type II restriction enzyme, methylase subunit YeeA [Brevundimonas diminuta 3F5N]|uniref:site-specific DNA-methyltransferase (adenine-specific) n=1 Tax=Brevundimonas diminuta 3F5N TaxID=1255603 RepID=A0A1R4FFX7_BREDI|nr:DNA methyltransferase [Brevundimonas diminuta]SJM54743.1 Type II restriction enzyme, methylase subunit YeeA [Brevundimonas diminuta 3F5N]
MNPVEIEEAVSKLALEPFDPAEFPFQFLIAFDNPPPTIKRLRSGATNQSDVPGGVLQRNNIHIATCAPGEVDATLKALRDSPKTTSAKAKIILATDGETFQAEDLNGGGTVACSYAEFPDHFGFFLPLAGITTVKEIRESSFDVKATGRLNKLYVQLLKENPDWGTAERQCDMNHFMARLIFCFFAEDTDLLLTEGLFTKTVEQMSSGDAANTHLVIGEIFRAMDTPPLKRGDAGLPPYAAKFPYVNGQLFSGNTDVPTFSKVARSYLLHVGSLPWQKINPDIFGSMIQAVTDDAERGSLGMHYTSVPNILKVLNPLFLDNLREQLEEAGTNSRKLLNLRNRMARIRVFDPACGSGNFLVIAYKAMREIESDINKRRGEPDRRSDIPLTNFRGIELRDFPAEIARLALIIAEYQCDVLYRGQKEAIAEFLPLGAENWITCGNSLRLDWLKICPPSGVEVKVTSDDLFHTPLDQAEIDFENEGGETYICGNPPYLGGKKQDADQKQDMLRVAGGRYNPANLDYICAFFTKAIDLLNRVDGIAFVTTSSISQGIHVPTYWPYILSSKAFVFFCYEPFKWGNNAANNAGVYCTILGLSNDVSRKKIVFFDGGKREVENINPYLIAGDDIVVSGFSTPISPLSKMNTGNQSADGGFLTLDVQEREALRAGNANVDTLIRRVSGTSEFFDGRLRWALWIDDDDLGLANEIGPIRERIRQCRDFRQGAGEVARTLAEKSHQFRYRNMAKGMGMIAPQVSSERREYIPSGIFGRDLVVTHKAHAIFSATMIDVCVFNSRMHFVWARTLSGRLGNGISYSSNLAWNTFPLPRLTEQNKADLTRCAANILLAREVHFPATIADLYDPENMPDDLRRAHEANDEVLERIYIGRRFRNDTERLEKLFELYTKMTTKKAAA